MNSFINVSCFTDAFIKENPHVKNYATFAIESISENCKNSSGFCMLPELEEIEHADSVCKEKILLEATLANDFNVVTTLVNADVSVDAEQYNRFLFYASKIYMTPLQIAAALGNWQCLQLLIDKGADVNAKDRFDVTATHMASEQGHYDCLKILLDAGANCCASTRIPCTTSKIPPRSYKTPPYGVGTTPLHLAVVNNHVNCVEELIYFGADYNALDDKGRTGLYIASQAGYETCVMAQLRNAVGRDILSLPGFESGDTPLHFAVRLGMIDSIRELLHLGSDVNHLNYSGRSPLHLCLLTPYCESKIAMDILHLLVLNGYDVDINQKDFLNLTPLHYVTFNTRTLVFRRNPEMAKFLIAYGANIRISVQGTTLILHELNSADTDSIILKAIVDCMNIPPKVRLVKEPDMAIAAELVPNNAVPCHTMQLAQRYGNNLVCEVHKYQDNFKKYGTLKQIWYSNLASNPPCLAHICRYNIRKSLGTRCLRYIKNLPVPNAIKSYLLLEIDV